MSLEQWKTFFEVGAVVLLFLTFVFGAGALYTGRQINARQAERLRQFDKELTDAKTELGKQEVRAAIAEQDAADAKTTAASANARAQILEANAANAKAEQQRVELDLEKQQERAAKAEKDLLEVRKRQEPRNLFAVDVEKIKAFLVDKPKFSVIVSCIRGDQESCTFASQIKNVLVECGWNVQGVIPKAFDGTPAGLSMLVPSENRSEPMLTQMPIAATVLNDTFSELGMKISFDFPISMSLAPGFVELVVGYR